MLHPAGALRGGQHLLVPGRIVEFEEHLRALLGQHMDATHLRGPSRRGVKDDDAQLPVALAFPQFIDASLRDHPAAIDDPHRVAQPLHQVELVAGEDDRHTGSATLQEDVGQGIDADRVQAAERLVEDQHLGHVHERGGQLHLLLVAQ